jgi:DoxX-like family
LVRTSILGAILLTGYLGGAAATHVRIGDPLFTHVLFPIYVGVLLWEGFFCSMAGYAHSFLAPGWYQSWKSFEAFGTPPGRHSRRNEI